MYMYMYMYMYSTLGENLAKKIKFFLSTMRKLFVQLPLVSGNIQQYSEFMFSIHDHTQIPTTPLIWQIFIASWRAKPASWAVLRLFWIMCVYIYVCALWISSLLVVYDAIDNASSSRATRAEN